MMISKRLHKKLARKARRKELKRAHQARLDEITLHYAKQIRAQLQVTTSAVPDNALYRNLTRMSEIELFGNIANADLLESSVLFDRGGPGNSWTTTDNETTTDINTDDYNDSPQSRCCRIIDRFVHRPHQYNIKYACQELSLIYQLYRLAYNPSHDVDLLDDDDNNNNNHSNSYYCCDAVIDIGGGNANLSCLISLILNVPVICVDYDPRHESLMAEQRIPQAINNTAKGRSNIGVTRVECMIQNYTLPSTYRHVLVLGKHCCGTGTDAGIEFVNTYSSQIRGVVFATCCCCKIAHGLGVRSIENVIPTKKDNNSNSDRACDNHNDDDNDDDDDDDIHEKEEEEEELNGVPVEAGLGNSSIQYFDSLYFSSTTTTLMCQPTGMEDTTIDNKMDCSVATTSMTAISTATNTGVHENERLLPPPQEHGDDNNVSKNNNSNCNTTTKYNLDNYTGLSGASARRLANAANNDNNDNNNDNKLKHESEIELYRRVLPEVARATTWRSQSHNVQDRKYKYDAVSSFHELIEQAEYFESWIQGFRKRRLVQLFGWVEEVLYCSDEAQHSQQNRCLVSGRRRRQQLLQNGGDAVGGATTTATTTTTTTTTAFLNLLEERFVQLKDILPIDLRPYGVVSRKYEYYPVA